MPPSSSTAAGRPRSSRRRWPTAPGGPARCRSAPCYRAAVPGPGRPAAVPHRRHPAAVLPAAARVPPPARRARHRHHRAGLEGRLPPGPVLLPRDRVRCRPVGAAEKPALPQDQLKARLKSLTPGGRCGPGPARGAGQRAARSQRLGPYRGRRTTSGGGTGLDATPVPLFSAARPRPAYRPATPTAAGTSARATTATTKTTRASRCPRSPGRWRPPSRSPRGRPARCPPRRTSRPAWPWPGPAKTPAAPAPGFWPGRRPRAQARLARLRPRLHRRAPRPVPPARPGPGLPPRHGLPR